MRKTKKQLLGLVCLAAVALMTAFAISLPAPDAAAADDEDSAYSEGNTQVQVRVEGASPSCHIESPTGNKVYVKNPIPVRVRCTKARTISVTYKYKDEDGNEHSGVLAEDTSPNYDAQEVVADLNLSDYADNVVVAVTATGNNGTESVPDSVSFSYRAMSTEVGDKTDPETGNPSLDIDVADSVEDVQICIYDKSGKPVFASEDDPENGCVSIKLADIDKETGKFKVTLPDGTTLEGTYDAETGEIHVELPMDKSGVGEGEYTVIVVGTDKDGNIVSMNRNEFNYKPVTPDLPNTGSIFGALNISRADYLITGLIAFGLVSGFAMVLIFRRNHHNN